MENIFVEFLPPWVETGLQPAFYDKESGTVLQQTARMYARVNMLIRMFNKLSKNTKEEVERFEGEVNDTVEEYINKFNELHDYVQDYFDNLDVQEEINNKLDQMALDGTLAEIINTYIHSNAVLSYDTLNAMKTDENLIDGCTCHILGRMSLNDGGENCYKVRTKTVSDVVDNVKIVQLHDNDLVAELIIKNDLLEIRPLHTRFIKNSTYAIGTDIWYAIIPSDYKPELFLANDAVNNVEHADTNAYRNKVSLLTNAGLADMTTGETIGLVINNGETLKTNTDLSSDHTIIYMTEDGTLNSVDGTTPTADVEALNPVWAVTAWDAIVREGVDYSSTFAQRDYKPRTFIGQDAQGNYIIGVCCGRQYSQQGMTYSDIKTFVESVGFTPYFLFNLDGGGSSIMVSDGQKINTLTDFAPRQVGNFIGWRRKDASDNSIFKSNYNSNRVHVDQESITKQPRDLLARIIVDPQNNTVVHKKGQTQSYVRVVDQMVFMQLAFTTDTNLAPYKKLLTNLPLPFTTSLMNATAVNINDHSMHTVMIVPAHADDPTVDGFAVMEVGRFGDLPAGDWYVTVSYPFKTAENDDNFTA